MNEQLRDAIDGSRNVSQGIGHYIENLIDEYGIDSVCSELEEMLHDKNLDIFLLALEFTAFIFDNISYIPGKGDKELMEKMKKMEVFDNLLDFFCQKKAYYHLNTLFSLINHLPMDIASSRVEDLIERYVRENCILTVPLMHTLTEDLGNVFPMEKYTNLFFEDAECGFITKYAIAQSEYLDAFARNDLLKALRGTCPQKYEQALEDSIAENAKYMSEDYFGDEDEGEGDESDAVQNVIDDYFDYCDDLTECDESITFEDFIKKGLEKH